ncbi:cytochrome c3 family protein [Chondromyces apiculatus]|uniref:Molybdopterin oxidoreductase subunit chaperone protein HtpG n=1 Tax=Chondromyces apiculatus DSM 436 TaxID=1192034 RepID=A0A017TB33_9BACT|nr:cytochrome c3 family protein [Chondromyces apiculatus]EYF06493.1 Molybdopterin oxidoreductase subunit chaperone protein HtpG [Chondromyces apiculatus DSM 436]
MARYIFPRWANKVLPLSLVFGVLPLGAAVTGGLWYYGTNKHVEVGYQPKQPVDYSHKLHAGDLGMDCRYCHNTVERSEEAAIPPTETCMNCHSKVRTQSPKLLPVRESWANDTPIPWVRVHNLADYVYFDHSAHLSAGVGCVTCHGRVDQMAEVRQVEPLSMSWCLDCHRNPGPNLRDPKDITRMDLPALAHVTAAPAKLAGGGAANAPVAAEGPAPHGNPVAHTTDGRPVNPPLHCSGCHR